MSSELTNTIILTKGLESALANTPIEDGKLRFTTDTGNLYLDVVEGQSSKRRPISEIIQGMTEEEIFNTLAALPKVYLSSDTHRAYIKVGLEWIDLAAVKLSIAPEVNVDKPLWFSDTTDEQPLYTASLAYNAYSGVLKTPNLQVSNVAYLGDMRIRTSVDSSNHNVIDIDFFDSNTFNFGDANDASDDGATGDYNFGEIL